MAQRKLALAIALLAALALVSAAPVSHAQAPSRVGLVVEHGDGSVVTRCIEFTEPEITGYEVLSRSGLELVTSFAGGAGGAVCTLDGEGCPASDCFCQCSGTPCVYWIYHQLVDGQWVYSNLGASSTTVRDGGVEGWAWGEGTPSGGAQPPVFTFTQICTYPPTSTPIPPTQAAPATPVPVAEAWFRLDANPIAAGTCTSVRWDASNADNVVLDGIPVPANGSRELCPSEPMELSLRVGNAFNERMYTLSLGVTAANTPTPQLTTPAPTPQPPTDTPSAAITATPSSASSTGAPTATAQTPAVTVQPAPTEDASTTATSTVVPTVTATATPTQRPTSTPTAQPQPSDTPEEATMTPMGMAQAPRPVVTAAPERPARALGYVAFGGVILVLSVGLILTLRRRP